MKSLKFLIQNLKKDLRFNEYEKKEKDKILNEKLMELNNLKNNYKNLTKKLNEFFQVFFLFLIKVFLEIKKF